MQQCKNPEWAADEFNLTENLEMWLIDLRELDLGISKYRNQLEKWCKLVADRSKCDSWFYIFVQEYFIGILQGLYFEEIVYSEKQNVWTY